MKVSLETEGFKQPVLSSIQGQALYWGMFFEALVHKKCWKKDHFHFIFGISLCQYGLINKDMR